MNVQKTISAYDPKELARQRPDALSDKDDGSHRVDDPDFFEWWYFDARGADGCTAVVAIRNRDYSKMHLPAVPQYTIRITTPKGEHRSATRDCSGVRMSASKDRCDVTIGHHAWALGRGSRYRVHAREDDVAVDLEYEGLVPGWRPGTGYFYFRPDRSKYFGWVVPLPKARVRGAIHIGDRLLELRNGVGYHDHNYGNTPIVGNIANWHWARTHAGDYTLVYCSGVLADLYGRGSCPNIMIARGDRILTSTGEERRSESGPYRISPVTMNRYAEEYRIEVPCNGGMASIRLYNNRLVEERDYLPLFKRPAHMSKPGYLRLSADMELTVPLPEGDETVRCKTIHELLILELRELSTAEPQGSTAADK